MCVSQGPENTWKVSVSTAIQVRSRSKALQPRAMQILVRCAHEARSTKTQVEKTMPVERCLSGVKEQKRLQVRGNYWKILGAMLAYIVFLALPIYRFGTNPRTN